MQIPEQDRVVDPIREAWGTLLREAQDRPWLAGVLVRRGAEIFARFVRFYQQLQALSRRVRRALTAQLRRQLATTLLGAALLLAISPARNAHAATIVVDGTICTLADAITAANNDAASGGCTAGSGADIIDLQTDVSLLTALPTITSGVTLDANGHTINGGGISGSVLRINGGPTVTINRATITGGNTVAGGGGVYNLNGTVTINDSTITGNTALSGGGVDNFLGTMSINNSTVTDNEGVYGGGIFNSVDGTLTINNSTVSGNTANLVGGGITNENTLRLNNSTVTGNTAVNYGGGLFNVAIARLNRSIVSGNTATAGHELYGALTATNNANNYNVIGYDGSARSTNFTPGTYDIVPGPGTTIASILDTNLANNGGSTLTHALLAGSLAVDVAPGADCSAAPINGLDQRGASRNVDGDSLPGTNECDAGAFEYTAPTAVQSRYAMARSAGGSRLGAMLTALALAGGSLWLRPRRFNRR